MLTLDFTSVPSREALAEGVYELQIVEVEETTSSTGNPMLKMTYDVLGVEGNRKLFDNFVLIDKCLWKIKELFDAIGLDTSQICEIEPSELIGYTVKAKVVQEEYEGETRNRVKKILA